MLYFKTSAWCAALALLTGTIGQLHAQQFDAASPNSQITLVSESFGDEAVSDAGCDVSCGCGCVEFWADATVFQFFKTGGVNVGSSDQGVPNEENADLGFNLSPRLNLRYYGSCGTYAQISYFTFDHGTVLSGTEAGSTLNVRNWTLDAVAGESFMLNCNWAVDLSAGFRMYDYHETAVDFDETVNTNREFNIDHSWGVGGVMGLKAERCLTDRWSAYSGVKVALLYGDHRQTWNRNGSALVNVLLENEVFLHTELSAGLEYRSMTSGGTEWFATIGAELISYGNASGNFITPGPSTVAETVREAGVDVGYA
ncbi:MAG: hypothetical protein KDA41_00375, partial [Planctomycetales bacterium]|nr:hypothetical protein [Planctomycetales bacterium]